MSDIIPSETLYWQYVEDMARSVLRGYGYEEIRLPLLERTELFSRSIGTATDIVEKEMYTFADRSGESLTLRPEGTAGCVRACIEHGLLRGQIQRLWYLGPMFRYERPQKGRYRQFHQIGVEAFGMEGPAIDGELILQTARIWQRLGLAGLRLEVNSLGSTETRSRYRAQLVEYLQAHHAELDEDSRRRLATNPLRILDSKHPAIQHLLQAAPTLIEHLDEGSRKHFHGLLSILEAAGVDYTVNPRLVRGLDYYTLTVFEWLTDRLGAQGAVCAGGRYDGLVAQFGGPQTAAAGYAIGMERLIALLQECAVQAPVLRPHACLLALGEQAWVPATTMAEELRNGLPALRLIVDASDASLKSKLKRADRCGARFALILGEEELGARQVLLKPLQEPLPQQTIPRAEVSAQLSRLLFGK
jgi:histidyl-tRNA synthetase